MKKIISALAVIVLLSGCFFELPIEIGRETRTYEITKIKQPKHFRVDLKDIKTGAIHSNVRISKRCIYWRKMQIGSKWDLMTVEYELQGERAGQRYVVITGARSLCAALKSI